MVKALAKFPIDTILNVLPKGLTAELEGLGALGNQPAHSFRDLRYIKHGQLETALQGSGHKGFNPAALSLI